jgi:hypothetical protein
MDGMYTHDMSFYFYLYPTQLISFARKKIYPIYVVSFTYRSWKTFLAVVALVMIMLMVTIPLFWGGVS